MWSCLLFCAVETKGLGLEAYIEVTLLRLRKVQDVRCRAFSFSMKAWRLKEGRFEAYGRVGFWIRQGLDFRALVE